jgi:hypothetical protein
MKINQEAIDEAVSAHREYQHHAHKATTAKAEAEDRFSVIGKVAMTALEINHGNNAPLSVLRQAHIKLGKAVAEAWLLS